MHAPVGLSFEAAKSGALWAASIFGFYISASNDFDLIDITRPSPIGVISKKWVRSARMATYPWYEWDAVTPVIFETLLAFSELKFGGPDQSSLSAIVDLLSNKYQHSWLVVSLSYIYLRGWYSRIIVTHLIPERSRTRLVFISSTLAIAVRVRWETGDWLRSPEIGILTITWASAMNVMDMRMWVNKWVFLDLGLMLI